MRSSHQCAIAAQVVEQLCVPAGAITVGGQRGRVSQRIHARHDPGRCARQQRSQAGVGNDRECAPQPGQVESLAGRHERDGARGGVGIERGERQVAICPRSSTSPQ